MRYLLTFIIFIFSIHSHAMEDLAALVQARFQGRVPNHLLPSRFAGYERIATNIRLLGGRSVLEPSSKGMIPYPMPQPAIMLSDPVFGTPLVPRNAADALLFFLFPYPNIFQATTLGSDPISRLEPKTLGQLARLCEEYEGSLAATYSDTQVMALEEDFTKALLKALNFDAKKYERLEPKLDAFNRWITVQAFARKLDTMAETVSDDERAVAALEHPDLTLPQCGLRNMFRGSQEFWGISGIELETLRHPSNEHSEVLQSFAENVLNEASVSFSTFENRVKDFGKMRLINLMVRGVVDQHYEADMNGLNLQSRLALFFWKKYQWALQEGNTTPMMAFYAHRLGIDPIEGPMNIVLLPLPFLTFDDIKRDPRQFFLLSLPEQEKIIKECAGAFIPINMHEGKVEDKKFSDCMETAIFNLATAMIHRVEAGKVILDPSFLPDCPLKTYLVKNPGDFHEYATKHSEWANAVAGIPSVKYLKTTTDGKGCEVRPGLISTLNALSFLFGMKDPLPYKKDASIMERLAQISTFIQSTGYAVTLVLDEKNKLEWSPLKNDFSGLFSLKKDTDTGVFDTSFGHGYLKWVTGNSSRVISLFDHAKTLDALLTTAPLVNNRDAFDAYMKKFRILSGRVHHLEAHLFQMDLTSLEMQKAVFLETYNQKSLESLALSIIQRLDGTNTWPAACDFNFLDGGNGTPSDEFLHAFATIHPMTFSIWNIFRSYRTPDASMSFWHWCRDTHKEWMIEAALPLLKDFGTQCVPNNAQDPSLLLPYLTRMPSLETAQFYGWDGPYCLRMEDTNPFHTPVFDFLTTKNFIKDIRGISLSPKTAFHMMAQSAKLSRLRFVPLNETGWTEEILRKFIDRFLTRNTYGESKYLEVSFFWEESKILDFMRSLNPQYLKDNLFYANSMPAPLGEYDPETTVYARILKEIQDRESTAATSAEGKTED